MSPSDRGQLWRADRMLFTSLIFWAFFAIFFPLYFLTRGRARLWVCVLGSYIFYGWWDWRFLALIGFLSGTNYFAGLKLGHTENNRSRKRWLSGSVVISLATLGFFKYFDFFIGSARSVLNSIGLSAGQGTLEIILPVGISFYTFQALSYTVDVYRRHIPVERSFLHFATFIAFFPQLVAGPIVRAADFLPQLKSDQKFDWERFLHGSCMIAWGFILKVVVADSLAPVVDARFAQPSAMSSISLIFGVVFYSFQIYGDFAGYSLMAIGFAKILGFQFKRNFDRPNFASSFGDFWRRWHLSLSGWIRDYVYFPLGGSRSGEARTYANLMITMLLCGLWHGAAWTFVAWGGLHGLFLCVERFASKVSKARRVADEAAVPTHRVAGAAVVLLLLPFGIRFALPEDGRIYTASIVFLSGIGCLLGVTYVDSWKAKFAEHGTWASQVVLGALQVMAVFSLMCLVRVFFRSQSFDDAWLVLTRILSFEDLAFSTVGQKFHVIKGTALIALLVLIEALSFRVDFWQIARRFRFLIACFLVACFLAISAVGTFEGKAFVYFQF